METCLRILFILYSILAIGAFAILYIDERKGKISTYRMGPMQFFIIVVVAILWFPALIAGLILVRRNRKKLEARMYSTATVVVLFPEK